MSGFFCHYIKSKYTYKALLTNSLSLKTQFISSLKNIRLFFYKT